jgi:hypothetical protein
MKGEAHAPDVAELARALRQVRGRCLALLGRGAESFLRSPLFLFWLRHGLGPGRVGQVLERIYGRGVTAKVVPEGLHRSVQS